MTDDQPPERPSRHVRPPTSGPRPASKLEIAGWVIVAGGVLVLVYFALTRSFA